MRVRVCVRRRLDFYHSAISEERLSVSRLFVATPNIRIVSLDMRLLCFAAVSLGVAAAFVPSPVPSTNRESSAAAQRNSVIFAASPRGSARRRSTAVGEGGGGTADVNPGSVGVIVCDHGSRRENANTMLFEVAERYRAYSGFDIVEVGVVVVYVVYACCVLRHLLSV